MNRQSLFVTGMVRSGTTLVSRAIDAHPDIVCPPDPIMGFFRRLYADLLSEHSEADNVDAGPIPDLFFADDPGFTLFEGGHLDRPLRGSIDDFRDDIRGFAKDNTPKLIPHLNKLKANRYSTLYDELLDLVCEAFDEPEPRYAGFKQTWVEAFAAVVDESRPTTCVHIVRDPRAVIASWKKTTNLRHAYPFLMMVRHWRKSVALSSLQGRRIENYLTVSYEDFVTETEREIRRICDFLDVEYAEEMRDPSEYRDGSGDPWASNTSYQEASGISEDYLQAWRKRLNRSEVQIIEDLCHLEMKYLGLERVTAPNGMDSIEGDMIEGGPPEAREDWIRGFEEDYTLNANNRAKEASRWLLTDKIQAEGSSSVSNRWRRLAFIDPDLPRRTGLGG